MSPALLAELDSLAPQEVRLGRTVAAPEIHGLPRRGLALHCGACGSESCLMC